MLPPTDLDGQLFEVLADLGVELERVAAGAFVVTLRTRRRTGHVWLVAGEQDVTVEAFVMHVLPEAQVGPLQRHLLFRNRELRGAHYCTDEVGDVFLFGSLSLLDVTAAGVDRLLGEIWQLLAVDTDRLLTLAYGDDVPDKALLDGAGRRMAGSAGPHRDSRR